MRRLMWLIALLFIAGCTPARDSGAPEAPITTTSGASAAAIAPDFTLALGEGGEFTLSAETRPVFMVFWAEW